MFFQSILYLEIMPQFYDFNSTVFHTEKIGVLREGRIDEIPLGNRILTATIL
jgi:hypothetical protein